ncbi:MAG TPA: 6-carboxytetrahydropterin synthase [bacterium]
MYTVTRVIHFSYGHRLLNYEGRCRFLHGHNGRVEVELRAAGLDAQGMVRDFDDIKQTIQQWIDDTLDHAMLLRKDDPLAESLKTRGERIYLMDVNPTAEAIARLIFDYALTQGLSVSEVRVWETERSVAAYRPD